MRSRPLPHRELSLNDPFVADYNYMLISKYINPRITKGGGYYPSQGFFFPDTLQRFNFTQNDFLITARASFAVFLMQKRRVEDLPRG